MATHLLFTRFREVGVIHFTDLIIRLLLAIQGSLYFK